MIRRFPPILFTVLILLIMNYPAGAVEALPDIDVLRSDDKGITLVYKPDLSKLTPAPNGALALHIPLHPLVGNPGDYPSALRSQFVIVPPGAKVSLNINSLKTVEISNVNLQRLPETDVSQSIQIDKITVPQEYITISQPFRFRRWEVVEIRFNPVDYNPAQKKITAASEITFSLNFNGGNPTGYRFQDRLKLDNVILNPGQAEKWAYPPQRKTVSQFPLNNTVKILVNEEGIYKITRSDLEGIGFNPVSFPFSLMHLYNNGGRQLRITLPLDTDPDSLIENAIYVYDADGDDSFDYEDYILFYGIGTSGWEYQSAGNFSHYINPYTYYNTYWLEFKSSGDSGKRMALFGSQSSASSNVNLTKARVFLEEEKVIYATSDFPGSGLSWYGDFFNGPSSRIYGHSFNAVASGDYRIVIRMKSVEGTIKMKVYLNDVMITNGAEVFGSNSKVLEGVNLVKEGYNKLEMENVTQGTMAYLDWYEIEYERYLQPINGKLFFESPGGSGVALYGPIEGLSGSDFIFRITDFDVVGYARGDQFKDILQTSTRERYCAFKESAFMTPADMFPYNPPSSDISELRSGAVEADYLLITHSDFFNAIQPLMSFWAEEEGLIVKRVDVSRIFDQFSWGLYDPAGIRNFLRYAVDNWARPPAYVAFIGDGDYDFRNILSGEDKNWIPPFENGLDCYDDYYACIHQTNTQELVLGRYTVQTVAEAQIVIDKVMNYMSQPAFGPWRSRVTLVADDEWHGVSTSLNEHDHIKDTEILANNFIPEYINTSKIYLMEYPIDPGAGGRKKPGAGVDLVDDINRGTVMVNFYGHGNEYVWADEQAFYFERDFPLIDNGDKLSIFIAGTCDWAYFDNPERQSFPEELLTAAGKGAIASIASTRLTYSDPNAELIENLFLNLFADKAHPATLGEALLASKLCCSNLSNSRGYHILGDPLLRPCFPRQNGEIASLQPDSLFAVNLTNASGNLYYEGQIWSGFSGTVYLEIFDAATIVDTTFYNSSETITYSLPGKIIFRGPFSAAGGSYSSNFVVPLDITYGGQSGRISLYFNDVTTDGSGFLDNLFIGAGGIELVDSDNPSAQIFFGDRSFQPGDPVSTSPLVIADLSDSSGVNLGSAAGHEIALIVDDNLEYDLTEYFEYQLDSYMTGTLEKQLDYLPPGVHNVKFRAFDSFNNPIQLEFSIETVDDEPGDDYLYGLLNYPNPFKDVTTFVFHLLQGAEIKIEIYTVAGRKIKTLPSRYCQDGYAFDSFTWDGRDEEGDKVANGVYLYKVKADFGDETVSKIGRLIHMR